MERSYEIKNTLAVLPPSKPNDTMHLEVNVISWYGADPKIDIRRWTDDRSKMSKGISLTVKELETIVKELGGEINGITI